MSNPTMNTDKTLAQLINELTPAAQAVMIAATNGNFNVVDDPVYKQCIAAALRAAADQVVPEQGCQIYGLTQRENERQQVRDRFLSIAAELGGAN